MEIQSPPSPPLSSDANRLEGLEEGEEVARDTPIEQPISADHDGQVDASEVATKIPTISRGCQYSHGLPSPDEDTQKLFKIFQEVRTLLGDNGFPELKAATWPILELDAKQSRYFGFCYCDHSEWKPRGHDRLVAQINRVDCVSIRVRDGRGNHLRLERLLSTLIHEFAHCLTPGELVFGGQEDLTKRKTKSWNYIAHSKKFYEMFADLLRIAEQLNIFILPSHPNKFGLKSLKRFDAVDLEDAPDGMCGTCPRYESSPDALPTYQLQAQQSRNETLRLQLWHRNQTKTAITKEKTVAELIRLACNKFKLKKSTMTFRLNNGTNGPIVTDLTLPSLPIDTTIYICLPTKPAPASSPAPSSEAPATPSVSEEIQA